jgi:hypothetical protein
VPVSASAAIVAEPSEPDTAPRVAPVALLTTRTFASLTTAPV